ncbi:MAG: hypothetical protein JW801_14470 [Bacteroidales bacterium]|nr:hypothetical protein [Bacteroidales bacterium]
MQNTLYDSDIVSLSYLPEDKLIEMIWKKNATSEEYRKMFGIVIEFSEKNQIRSVLSDMRNEGLVRLDDVRWLDKEVLTRAIEHKLQRIALIIEETIFSSVYTDVVKKKLDKSPVQVRAFYDLSSARAWLLSE